jgi:hypothetical protein
MCAIALGAIGLIRVTAPADGSVELRRVDPVVTGPGIRALTDFPPDQVSPNWIEGDTRHVVAIDPPNAAANRLFVYFVGSGALPAMYEEIMRHAAGLGYHAVSLAHPNWPAVRDLLENESDPGIASSIRRERLYGVDEYGPIDVPYADSVQNRLVRLLVHSQGQHPAEDWLRFLTPEGLPRWPLIVVSGHSQGAGHAAYLSRDHELAGVVMFAGPGDFVQGQQATWLLRPSATPEQRLFAFTHVQDSTASAFFLNQRTLGLDAFGPIVSVDQTPPPYGGSRMLTTFLEPAAALAYHGAPVIDYATPRDAQGNPVYAPVWTYLLASLAPAPCTGDADASRAVDFADVTRVLATFNNLTTLFGPGDADGNGIVNFADITAVLANFNAACP